MSFKVVGGSSVFVGLILSVLWIFYLYFPPSVDSTIVKAKQNLGKLTPYWVDLTRVVISA